MAGFNLPEELLYSEDIKKKKPLLDLMSTAEDEVRSPTGAPTPYTVMENEEIGPQPLSTDTVRSVSSEGMSQQRDPRRDAAIADYEAMLLEQKAELPELAKTAKAIDLGSRETDFSPLLSLTDTWTGSNFSKSYKAPDSPEDLAYKKAQVNQMVQKARGDVTAGQLGLIKQLDDRANFKEAAKLKQMEQTDLRGGDNFGAKILKDIEGDSTIRKTEMARSAAADLDAMLDSGSPISAAAIPNFAARMSGEVGSLTEGDKRGFKSSQEVNDKLTQILQTYFTDGKLSPENERYMREFSSALKRSAAKKIVDRKTKLLDQYEAAQSRFGRDRLKKIMALDQDEETLRGLSVKPAATSKIIFSNGKETFEGTEADLQEAAKEGFQRVK